MTTVGHSLAGLSIAVLTLPTGRSLLWYVAVGHLFILFANLPDLPLPGWGHANYEVSHSVFVTMLLASTLGLLMFIPGFDSRVGFRVLLFWSLTWLSHMVLDSMYNHGLGIGVFWPFSDAHLVLPVPWFETLTWPPITEHNRHVFLTEIAVFGAVLAACLLLRHRRRNQ